MPKALEFDRWIEQERARLAARAAAAAWALVDQAQRRGDLASAADWARRLLSVRPDDERALRRELMLLHTLGDRAAALRAYRDFARRIAVDYELEPADETNALVAAIRSPGRHASRVGRWTFDRDGSGSAAGMHLFVGTIEIEPLVCYISTPEKTPLDRWTGVGTPDRSWVDSGAFRVTFKGCRRKHGRSSDRAWRRR